VERCRANGITVHLAADEGEARRIVADVLAARDVRIAVKSKSMLSEEIDLNPALEARGVEVVETDLGEYVVQLMGDRPSHIIAPIIHRTRGEVKELFEARAGRVLGETPEALTAYAREALREKFLAADAGITGVNFGVAETGTLVLLTNEGNARLATSAPRVHVALMGIERLVPRLGDLAVLVPLLAGSGTGQLVTTYVSMLDGPRRAGEPDGPEEVHLVLVDNGRGALVGSRYEDVLRCIRCGACQNVCPVYRQVGGHAYGWVYGGPIGAVLTPLFQGQEHGGELPHASSLCGACDDACPVGIPLHDLLGRLRRDRTAEGHGPRAERIMFRLWARAWSSPTGYRLSVRVSRAALPLLRRAGRRRLPLPVLSRWTRGRDLPR
jgi:L-lactate dehydrogenase complex protein LldF